MKKTFLTFVAVGFGVSVAFAQTTGTPQEGQQQDTEITQQGETTFQGEEEEGKRRIEMYELPVAVQDAFQNSEYKDMEVLAIYELSADYREQEEQAAGTTDTEETVGTTDNTTTGATGGTTATTGSDAGQVSYAFELAESQAGQTAEETTTDDGLGGVETERVSERQADMMVVFDENGQVVKEKDADEMKMKEEHKSETDY